MAADSCSSCVHDAMDKLWFCQNVLFFEPDLVVSLQSKLTRPKSISPMKLPGISSHQSKVIFLLLYVVVEHIGYMDILALIHVCFNCIIQCSDESANRQSLNIITGQPIFQLQPLPRSRIRSHSSLPSTSSTGSHPKNTRESRVKNYRSLSELENYELKGFMDLGFLVPKDKLSPHIMSMVPGLQKLTEEDGEQEGKRWVRRPYLSEAWPVDCPDSPLLNLHMLPKTPDGADMKKHLKFWAQRVAMLVHEEP